MPQSLHLSCGNEEKVPQVLKAWGGQEEVEENPTRQAFSDTFEAAALAATFTGGFEPASFSGAGMTAPSTKAIHGHLDARQSGIIYTPPTYSDHVAVVCHFKFEADVAGGQGGGRNSQRTRGQRSASHTGPKKAWRDSSGAAEEDVGGVRGRRAASLPPQLRRQRGRRVATTLSSKTVERAMPVVEGKRGGRRRRRASSRQHQWETKGASQTAKTPCRLLSKKESHKCDRSLGDIKVGVKGKGINLCFLLL